jgi:threonine dehydratase
MIVNYVKKILNADIYGTAVETPIDKMTFLSQLQQNNILVKREDLQPIFSFKIRGACNKINKLPADLKAKGVIAASAGNHAQGVALAATKNGIPATIVMPLTTPAIKVASVKKLGGKVILYGENFNEAFDHSLIKQKETGATFIHPYDDPDVIAGQGTIGMEILQQISHKDNKLDAIFIPVGGGGLIAGIASYIKYLRPNIKIIGVEAEDSACLAAALNKRKRIILPKVGIFTDGVAVKQIGKLPYKIAIKYVDEVLTVNTDEICAAIKDLFNDTRSIAEPAGALAIAGIKKYIDKNKLKNKTLLGIESGANVNFDRLRHISERAEIGEKREAILAVTIPEEPGSFLKFCKALKGYSITEFNYRYSDKNKAIVFAGIQLLNSTDKRTIITYLEEMNYNVIDMTDNELAIIHIRHMVGGRCSDIKNERLYRFAFPESPNALLNFLKKMNNHWNISMFHYRNHGAAFGRVFLGLQIPNNELKLLPEFLKNINYQYIKEDDNPACKLFLK